MKNLLSKLCLGTVQFGLAYGIANEGGQVPKEESREILSHAYDLGIRELDTAFSYGESEALIGDFIRQSKKEFRIISKAPHLDNSAFSLEDSAKETLKKTGQGRLYGYLIHRFSDLSKYKGLFQDLCALKQKGLTEKIGFSIYKPEELSELLNAGLEFDILQVPYNVFDQRFKEYFPTLKERKIAIYARSVFLQGLFFLRQDRIDADFSLAKKTTEKLKAISQANAISVAALCLCFVLLEPSIDKIIIGVDSLGQLKENLESMQYLDRVKDIYTALEALRIDNEEIILPNNWKK